MSCIPKNQRQNWKSPQERKLPWTVRANIQKRIEKLLYFRKEPYNGSRQKERMQYVVDYLKSHPCVDCEEKNILVLQFDHVKGEKLCDVGISIRKNNFTKMKEEIEKCEVRCANCHQIKTLKTTGSWKFKFL